MSSPSNYEEVLRASPASGSSEQHASGFITPVKNHQEHYATSSNASAGGSSKQSGQRQELHGHAAPGAPSTSASHVHALTQRWSSLSTTMKGHAQSTAELLMQQAGSIAQTEDLVKHLLHQLSIREEEKLRLEAQVLQDRADFTSQAKLLSQHFSQSHHRNTALQVANESLQGELRGFREQGETAARESHALRQQLAAVQKELLREHSLRTHTDAALQEHGAAIEEMQQELQHSRSCCKELNHAKAQLQDQVKAMVGAERELTENLKHTHAQIDQQLSILRDQLQQERQKRMQVNRRKVELAQQVQILSAQLEACTQAAEQEEHQLQGEDSQGASPSVKQQLRKALNASKIAPTLRNSLLRRARAIKVAMPSARAPQDPKQQQPAGYTAAFAPPSTAASTPRAVSGPRLTLESTTRTSQSASASPLARVVASTVASAGPKSVIKVPSIMALTSDDHSSAPTEHQ